MTIRVDKYKMRTDEVIGKKFYHGSYTELPVGTVLKPRDDYEKNCCGFNK